MASRKSSEPACRVCGCTEHNACDDGCSWVKVEKESPPLCSACSGTARDITEAVARILTAKNSEARYAIATAATRREKARTKLYAANPDPAWGNR